MKTNLIIGAAALAAVGLFLYSRKPKAPTAAVAKLTPLEQARAAAEDLLESAKRLGSSLGASTAPTTRSASVDEGDIHTARASAAQTHILYTDA